MIAASMRALSQLDASRSVSGASLDIVWGDELAELAVTAGDFAQTTLPQLHEQARSVFEGDTPTAMRVHLQPDKRHLFVAGVDAWLLAELRDLALDMGLRLRWAAPMFVRTWNAAYAGALRGREAVFAVAGDGHAVLAAVSAGTIRSIDQGQLAADAQALDDRLQQWQATPALVRPSRQAELWLAGWGVAATSRWRCAPAPDRPGQAWRPPLPINFARPA